MPKPTKDIKLTAGKRKQIADALALATAHYAPLAEAWSQLTPAQREAVLAHSPVLAGIVAFARQFEVTHGTGL